MAYDNPDPTLIVTTSRRRKPGAALTDPAMAAADDETANPDKETSFPLKWKKKTLAVLFGSAEKKTGPPRLSQEEIEAMGDLMTALAEAEALVEAEEDARLDDGAVEITSDDEYVAI
ncbi:hypothetical protein B0H14DRAFT_3427574 [Mycena olivaceomarginata]|nr:hypothetical protein B0H14DRAFT_3427574 [Mycena olivaceomarginata]